MKEKENISKAQVNEFYIINRADSSVQIKVSEDEVFEIVSKQVLKRNKKVYEALAKWE